VYMYIVYMYIKLLTYMYADKKDAEIKERERIEVFICVYVCCVYRKLLIYIYSFQFLRI
jgi:hypothetical protein